MRTVLTFVPGLLCAGTMFACFRMMAGKHHASGTADHNPDASGEDQPQAHARPMPASEES